MAETNKATTVLDRSFTIAQIDPRKFGLFIKHLGRPVYGGFYADDDDGPVEPPSVSQPKLSWNVIRLKGGAR